MTEIQKKNEERIFCAIQKLKDSVFGMNSSYVNYCYSYKDGFYHMDNEKMNYFILELVDLAKTTQTYQDEFEQRIYDILFLGIKYIEMFCPFDDQNFAGLRKIAESAYKTSLDYKSTFDILINDQKEQLDLAFLNKYEDFTSNIIKVDFQKFYKCIKHSLEAFIDKNNLNCLYAEELTNKVVFKIERLSQTIQFANKQNNSLEVTHYDK